MLHTFAQTKIEAFLNEMLTLLLKMGLFNIS